MTGYIFFRLHSLCRQRHSRNKLFEKGRRRNDDGSLQTRYDLSGRSRQHGENGALHTRLFESDFEFRILPDRKKNARQHGRKSRQISPQKETGNKISKSRDSIQNICCLLFFAYIRYSVLLHGDFFENNIIILHIKARQKDAFVFQKTTQM